MAMNAWQFEIKELLKFVFNNFHIFFFAAVDFQLHFISYLTSLIQCSIIRVYRSQRSWSKVSFHFLMHIIVYFSWIYISHNSVTMQLRCNRIFNNQFVTNCL